MNKPPTGLEAVARRFGPSNFAAARPQMRSDFTLLTHWCRKLTATMLVALLPIAATATELNPTYGQQIVATVLMAEAGGEGAIGMMAVAEVIRNRAEKARQSPLQIVLKKGQFSCLNNITPEALYQKFYRMRTYQTALRIAKTCYNTPEKLPNLTKRATFFCHTRNKPYWLGDVRPVTTIGNHRFYVSK
jgi:spore germination cell wall hydrolase CwlJ-like protein